MQMLVHVYELCLVSLLLREFVETHGELRSTNNGYSNGKN